MIKGFEQILKQFTSSQRLIVLVLLLIFTSGSILLSQYLKTDDCRPLIEENIRMHQDFAKISAMLRGQTLKDEKISREPASDSSASSSEIEKDSPAMIDSILVIADSHN